MIKFRNLNTFKLELRKFNDLTEQQHQQLLRKVALQLLRAIVEKTPVDTGRARGNWQVAVDTGAGTAKIEGPDPSGEVAVGSGFAALTAVQPFSVIVIFNNVEYIAALEHGHSGQAPRGMVAISIAEVDSQFR